MENSAYEALYTGAYILVFIMALTVALYLFNSINDFADLAYEFNTTVEDKSTIINAPTEANILLTGEEVLSYYYNYVKHDLYTEKESLINYNVKIFKSPTAELNYEELKNLPLNEIAKKIGMDNKYILKYETAEYDGDKKNITISLTQATPEQIEAIL